MQPAVGGRVIGFAGKNVFITGGSSGIGKQLAIDFLRLGARVTIAADDPAKLAQAHADLLQVAPSVDMFVCDIADLDQIRRTAEMYVDRVGAPDILVNNAGYAVYRTIEEMPAEELDRLLRVNLTGACLVTRAFLPAMIAARRGSIVMVASIAGRLPMTPCGPYSTAKHGLVAFADILQSEIHRFGLRVHVICPGRVDTNFFAHETFVERTPRRETTWTIPIEKVSRATIAAITRNRFMTYVPRSFGLLVWCLHVLPGLSAPVLRRLMRARVEAIYEQKQLRDRQRESAS